MNHTDWLQLGFAIFSVIANFFAAHQGAKKGASQD